MKKHGLTVLTCPPDDSPGKYLILVDGKVSPTDKPVYLDKTRFKDLMGAIYDELRTINFYDFTIKGGEITR